ncbi:MAG: long-chain fatty acid--CoA ligase [Acidimicrobiia bacterium]|nr:long-chain fatty acid--CoA ligase [Acidimicrobiia bacterium]
MSTRPWHTHYTDGMSATIDFEPRPLDHLLAEAAGRWPNRTALVFFDHSLTFAELDRDVDRLAGALQAKGIGVGDRVSVFMPNCPQTVIAYEAIWRIGAIAVPSNPLYTATEFAHQASDAGSRAAIVLSLMYPRVVEAWPETSLEHVFVTNIKEYFKGPMRALFTILREKKDGHRVDLSDEPRASWFQDALDDAPEPVKATVDPEATAVLMYTGGTTGVPKGAELSHRNLLANAVQVAAFAPELTPGAEVALTALPLTHSYSITVSMNHSLMQGYTQLVIPDARDLNSILKVIDKHKPTVFPGVPTLYSAISRHRLVESGKFDISSINFCISGAAALPPEVQRHFHEVTGARLVEGYGLSEASPVTHCNPLGEDHIGTIGVPLPSTDARIVDEATETKVMPIGERGVLCISGPQVMKGYWNMPEETATALRTDSDGTVWLHTGDVAVMDETGLFRIVDRKKDMILASGGFNVYPREIEDALYEHPAVREAGVIGVPVGGQNQRVKAFVAVDQPVESDELIAFCRERLARYKIPREIEFRDELPKTFVGKVLRRELMAEEAAREAE